MCAPGTIWIHNKFCSLRRGYSAVAASKFTRLTTKEVPMPNSYFVVIGLCILATIVLLSLLAHMFRKAGPNEALIVYGFRGPRVIKGHGTVIFPVVEHCRELSLELMSFDVAPQQDLYTRQGVAVTVEAVAQIKVRSDQESILTAAEQFLTKTPDQREGLIRLVMEGHLRGIIGQLTVEQIVKEPEMVAERMRSTCADDMSKMGLEVVSFTIREVRDKNEYITNMGRPDIARIKRDAEIASAEAERDTAIRRANALREAAIAKAASDQDRVIAETASLAKQAEAQRDLDISKAQFAEQSRRQEAQADKAYELQTNVMQQKVIAEQVKVQQIEKEGQVKVQEAEILRNEKELIATVLKRSEIEKQRIENMATAERARLTAEAEGRASAIRAQGEAEAAVILQKGEAEAKAMNVKAEAYQEWSQAAVVDKLITNLADVVRAMSEPLSKVDKITIVSTGNDGNVGAHKLTGEMTQIAAQVPALFEALSGMKMSDLMANVKQMKPYANGDANNPPLR
jgi:flotillin